MSTGSEETTTAESLRSPVILGAADGVTLVMGLTMSLLAQPHAVWHAALGSALAEFVGMTASLWLSDGSLGFWRSLACGAASMVACALPAVPYLLGVPFALGWAILLMIAVGSAIAWLRPERGAGAIAKTFGVLLAAALLAWGATL